MGCTLDGEFSRRGEAAASGIVPVMTTTITDPKIAAVERLYAAYAHADIGAVLVELADDIDWAAEAASDSVPWYGAYRGRTAVPAFFTAIGESVQVTEFTVLGYTANATDVVATVRWAYTVRATGKRAAMLMQHWWRFDADGKIFYFRGSEDSAQSVAALR